MNKLQPHAIPNTLHADQTGQAILILLLATLVALTIGLAITQRSLTDVATSTRIDQSSRAFSAAEAGIERAIAQDTPTNINNLDLGNQSQANVVAEEYPKPNQALEFPEIDKAGFAHFWLVSPDQLNAWLSTPSVSPTSYYNADSIGLFFGKDQVYTNANDRPGLEVNLISLTSTGTFTSSKYFFDSYPNQARATGGISCLDNNVSINTSFSSNTSTTDRPFYCRATINDLGAGGATPILIRTRILYASGSHPVALKPANTASLPIQVAIYNSTGVSGQTQRRLRLFTQKNVVPFYFDYALFSASAIEKE